LKDFFSEGKNQNTKRKELTLTCLTARSLERSQGSDNFITLALAPLIPTHHPIGILFLSKFPLKTIVFFCLVQPDFMKNCFSIKGLPL